MKSLIAGLLIVALIALAFLNFRGQETSDLEELTAQSTQDEDPGDPEELAPIDSAGRLPGATWTDKVVEEKEKPPMETPACIVIGVLQDENNQPIADASVTLSGYTEWAEGFEAERLPGRYDMRGFATTSDAQGAFRFEVPVPTVEVTSLKVQGDRFHDSAWLRFGAQDRRSLPALTAGTRDLGVIPLVRTGALAGKVIDESGQPLADVKISIGPKPNMTFGRDTWTNEDGTYVLGHAPAGTYGVNALLEGYLRIFQEPVEVKLGQDTREVNFVLPASPTIEGWVTDQDGQPLEGVKVGGWPKKSGRYARATSDDRGYFKIYLPQVDDLTLQANKDGYATWGNDSDRNTLYAPGTRDLRITLQAVARTKFFVIDEDSGESIRAFGLTIYENEGSQSRRGGRTERRRPPIEEHELGYAEATCKEGVDLYLVAADGYPLATGDVQWDVPGVAQQTLRIRKGASVTGRVLRDGTPVSNALASITELSPNLRPTNTKFHARCDDEGRFALHGLAQGLQQLTVTPDEGAPLVLEPMTVEASGEVDLGDLHLLEGARVTGRVLLPAGIDPAGLEVYLGDWRDNAKTVLDPSGSFEFTDLSAGNHKFSLGGRPGVLEEGAKASVAVQAGQSAEVQIDARDYALCHVSLTLILRGYSLKDSWVHLTSTTDPLLHKGNHIPDDSGQFSGFVRAFGECSVHVRKAGVRLENDSVRLMLTPGGKIEQTITFEVASLSLQVPPSVKLPDQGWISVQLTSTETGEKVQERTFQVRGGKEPEYVRPFAEIVGNRLVLAGLPPGEFSLAFKVGHSIEVDPNSPMTGVTIHYSDGVSTYNEDPYYSADAQVALKVGKELSVSLD